MSDLSTAREESVDLGFGRWLTEAIVRSGKFKADVARESGVELWRIRALERGRVKRGVTTRELHGLCRALRVLPEVAWDVALGRHQGD